jgi:glycosyltransferase involved in cell wall biosynthesis
LAAAVSRLDQDERLAREHGVRALAFAREAFAPATHRRQLEHAYARVVAEKAARPGMRTRGVVTTRRVARPSAGGASPGRRRRRPEPALRVLMSHCYYRDLGGENLSFEAEVEVLRAFGQEVVTYTRDNRELDRLGVAGKMRAGVRTVWAQDTYRELEHLIARQRPDVAHFQNTFPLISPSAFHAAHRQGVPVVLALRNYRLLCVSGVLYRDGRVCEDCLHAPALVPGVVHACYRGSHAQSAVVAATQMTHRLLGTWTDAVDLFVVPTAFGRGKFIEAGLPAERIVVKPNFVHPDPGPNPGPGSWAVYAGRLAPEKGVMTMLEAWRLAAPMPLRIVGDGPLRREAAAFVARHGLEGRVEVLGPRPPAEVMAIMREARLVVFPSEWYETFGRVAAEAFACGVPVVASRLGAMGEVVGDGVTGLHFASGDAADLAAKVEWAASHPQALARMGQAARQEYERTYTAEQNYHRLLEVYELARRRAAATAGSVG